MNKKATITTHTILNTIMYLLNASFQTELGKKLTNRGIRGIIDKDMSNIYKLIVLSENYFVIFNVEEYILIVRAPCKIFLRIGLDEAKKDLD
ncbi:MAG: hypothetical protein M1475_02320 [Actinobacteria bacterium]|nr:hypothetical protein [Actinomycetota bacterium]